MTSFRCNRQDIQNGNTESAYEHALTWLATHFRRRRSMLHCSAATRMAAHPESGFTLVEILVALAVFSISFGLLLSVISNGLRYQTRTDKLIKASSLAQSLLARVGTEWPVREEQRSGSVEDALHWRVNVSLYQETPLNENSEFQPYRATAEVYWRDGGEQKSVVLTTLRLSSVKSRP